MIRRVLLKLSGEYLKADDQLFSSKRLENIQKQLLVLQQEGIEVGIVLGGGNIFRGKELKTIGSIHRYDADSIGTSATLVNALTLASVLRAANISTKVLSPYPWGPWVEIVNLENAKNYLKNKEIVIFAGGTGHAYCSTDTAAALRACEIQADLLLKATNVGGVYDQDPHQYPDAKKFDHLTYNDVIQHQYQVMDISAFAICKEQKMPIFIFNLLKNDAIIDSVKSQKSGTLITEK